MMSEAASVEGAELGAVVAEFGGAMSSANSKTAARLIVEARRERDAALARIDASVCAVEFQVAELKAERDMALAREADWESQHAKLSELHDADVRRLTAERDAALSRPCCAGCPDCVGIGMRGELKARTAERDAAREELRAIGTGTGYAYQADGHADEAAPASVIVDAFKNLERERDAAIRERNEARNECQKWIDKSLDHAAKVNAERDAALARIRDLEDAKGYKDKADAFDDGFKQGRGASIEQEHITTLEAQLAEARRERDEALVKVHDLLGKLSRAAARQRIQSP